MKTMIDFSRTLLLMPKPWVAWVGMLLAANMAAPLFFIDTLEAKVVLAALMAGGMTQMIIFRFLGFVRLLGIGHIYWIPILFWLWGRMDQVDLETNFGKWLIALMILNGISLVIDIVDVIRYLKGEREPQFVLGT